MVVLVMSVARESPCTGRHWPMAQFASAAIIPVERGAVFKKKCASRRITGATRWGAGEETPTRDGSSAVRQQADATDTGLGRAGFAKAVKGEGSGADRAASRSGGRAGRLRTVPGATCRQATR